MPPSPQPPSAAEFFFYLDADGNKQDADIHLPIIASGDIKRGLRPPPPPINEALMAPIRARHRQAFERARTKSFAPRARAAAQTLYVNRPLLNGDAVRAWAASQGIAMALPADDMHVTIAFSKKPVDWSQFEPSKTNLTVTGGAREMHQFPAQGEQNGALVILFASQALTDRWQDFRDGGAVWSYAEYQPHVTITYSLAAADVAKIEPYRGPLVFGPEQFAKLSDGAGDAVDEEPT